MNGFFPLKKGIFPGILSIFTRKPPGFPPGPQFWTDENHLTTDKKPMSFNPSFKQILQEKMDPQTDAPAFSGQSGVEIDSLNLAFLMGKIRRFEPPGPRGNYPKPHIRPTRKAHNFTITQQESLAFFQAVIVDLSENFSALDLKKAFRQAAKILHPDQGGNAEKYMTLKNHYEILRPLVIKE